MKKYTVERKIVVVLFLLVFVVFSLAERYSKQFGYLYPNAVKANASSPVAFHFERTDTIQQTALSAN